ncbi:hypothetical protein [Sporolactobacillus vineae]|uniref:hypothetical protein n=1 Tax=Sporolactobacillus vineae TaxID=444463 RepID=UPI000288872E|nr:hypothetical protein [Sporolactobacillus vineae]
MKPIRPLKLNLLSCGYGLLLAAATMLLFRPAQTAALLHISPDAAPQWFFLLAAAAAAIYYFLMKGLSGRRPKGLKATIWYAVSLTLWFPYWAVFVALAFIFL